MSTFRNPVGPQPPQVYWRRRLIVGLGVLAVLIVVILIIVRPSAGAPNDDKKSSAETTPKPTDAALEQEEGQPCNPATIKLEAITDQNQYAAGVNPLISLSVTNIGSVACLMNVGTTQQVFEITSGSETYWKSTDCQSTPVDLERLLEPGIALTTEPIPWDRTRSDPATCTTERTGVTAGGATYHLNVTFGEVKAESTAPFLLY